jgi:murein L,D-transpeptidase YafK
MKCWAFLLIAACSVLTAIAQPGNGGVTSFVELQKHYPRVAASFKVKEDTLKKQFEKQGLAWPARQVYIRSFKYDGQLEVWVRNTNNEPYKLFKTYRVCAMAGSLGPKRMEGDYQVPEGFYYINEFNPRSTYHLSLGLNYPNASDRILSDSIRPGGDIYIHGSCVTVGCIPVQDSQIEELYVLASYARNSGEDFIPVHIFPIRYNNPRSVQYLEQAALGDASIKKFALSLKEVYDVFEKEHKLPVISVNSKGGYVVL